MSKDETQGPDNPNAARPPRRRRYKGTHPRRLEDKYKELDPAEHPELIEKVLASGKTPAGQHRPILVAEVLERLSPKPGDRGADVTFGHGAHAEAILSKLSPGGELLALDVDAVQLTRSEARLRTLGHGQDALVVRRCNYAGLEGALRDVGWTDGLDFVFADLGLSSMQIDDPARGFSYKHDGPLDMRMNPERGVTALGWLERTSVTKLASALEDGGDEPRAELISAAIVAAVQAGRIEGTLSLRAVIEEALPTTQHDRGRRATVARVFQAIRIVVNEEFGALDAFLRQLPECLRPGGRAVILSFHSGEDRRVKHHFRESLRAGIYEAVAQELIRPTVQEVASNPRAAPAKLRWAVRAPDP